MQHCCGGIISSVPDVVLRSVDSEEWHGGSSSEQAEDKTGSPDVAYTAASLVCFVLLRNMFYQNLVLMNSHPWEVFALERFHFLAFLKVG